VHRGSGRAPPQTWSPLPLLDARPPLPAGAARLHGAGGNTPRGAAHPPALSGGSAAAGSGRSAARRPRARAHTCKHGGAAEVGVADRRHDTHPPHLGDGRGGSRGQRTEPRWRVPRAGVPWERSRTCARPAVRGPTAPYAARGVCGGPRPTAGRFDGGRGAAARWARGDPRGWPASASNEGGTLVGPPSDMTHGGHFCCGGPPDTKYCGHDVVMAADDGGNLRQHLVAFNVGQQGRFTSRWALAT